MQLFGKHRGIAQGGERPPARSGGERAARAFISLLVGIIIACVLFLIPLPYFIYMPGSAEEVKPMVSVKAGGGEEKGALMLTTVLARNANVATYLIALVHPYEELALKQTAFQPGESQEEYLHRQEYVMLTSQSSAIQAAYRKAGVPYHISSDGVMVLRFVEGLPAAKVLRSGDIIVEANGKPVAKTEDLLQILSSRKPGDHMSLSVKRGEQTIPVELQLSALKDESGASAEESRVGLGILNPADVQTIKADVPEKQVEIAAGEIGGPSAGLMFALEIYNQLVPEDITKGYRIAGTGTIDEDGRVGAIGGIKHKVIAADRQKAEIFFAPKDYDTEDGYRFANYSDAAERAKKIGTDMKVVPIGSLDEALAFLAALPQKP